MATNGKKKTRKRIIIWGIIGVLVIALGVVIFLGSRKENVITVQVEKAQRRTITQVVTATGKIQPEVMVKISPEVSGEIVALPVKEGDRVKKGDLLMKIKPDMYTAQRDQASAGLLSARAELARTEPEFKRISSLFEKGLVSESEHDQARAYYRVGQSAICPREGDPRSGRRKPAQDHRFCADGRDRQPAEFRARRAGAGDAAVPGDGSHDDRRPLTDGSAGGCVRNRRDQCLHRRHGPGLDRRVPGPEGQRARVRDREHRGLERARDAGGGDELPGEDARGGQGHLASSRHVDDGGHRD